MLSLAQCKRDTFSEHLAWPMSLSCQMWQSKA